MKATEALLNLGQSIWLDNITREPLEIHLMVTDPDFFLDEFVEAGSDSLLVHWEGNANLQRTVQRIKALGKAAGVVINPATAAAVLEEILARCRPSAHYDSQKPRFRAPALRAYYRAPNPTGPSDDRTGEVGVRCGSGRRHRRKNSSIGGRRWSKRSSGWYGDFW
jgi:Ribulose-phosphate 3 epimerase family